jgi:hypothetical protein
MDNLSDTEKDAAIRQMAPPLFRTVFNIPHPDMSAAYLETMHLENLNQANYIESVKISTWDGRKITFNPPFEHKLGDISQGTVEVLWSPHPSKENYIEHLQQGLEDRIKFVDHYKKTLGIN